MDVFVEKFADIKILRFELTDFEKLNLNQKLYIYYLGKAALCGRDILWDQNNRYNLKIRTFLELVYTTFKGDRNKTEFSLFHTFLKRIWFANGIHHHYSMEKFDPVISLDDFKSVLSESDLSSFEFIDELDDILDVIFNPEREMKRVSLNSEFDLLNESAMNYYVGVTQQEAESFYKQKRMDSGKHAPSFGLNSQLMKEGNSLKEIIWKLDGGYGKAIQEIIYWLEKAIPFAENKKQQEIIKKLIDYYRSGDLDIFDEYSIAWVKEVDGMVDFINGFIEVYGDPLGIKGSWESIVNYKDIEASERARILSENAMWFEANSPVDDKYKKFTVKGVTAKVIHVAMLGGDCYPHTPIGINLPNAEWIREQYGSKSVTIENITHSYFLDSLKNGMMEEFAASDQEIERAKKYGYLANNLHTDLHECLGHGSGKMMDGVNSEDLKNYYSTIEETRADLFALYYIADEKLQDLGIVPAEETGKAEYDSYIRNGLITQLTRIEPGKNIEESHMRNRQLIANWCYQHGKNENVIEFFKKGNKTYVKINNYRILRNLFGELLKEVQRIKSEGDLPAAKNLIENFGVKVDVELHQEVLIRFKELNISPYAGFVNPNLHLVKDSKGKIADVLVDYSADYTEQMLSYSKDYGLLV